MQNLATEDADPKTIRLNAGLALIDKSVQAASFSPAEQLGLLFMCHVLAMRRLMAAHGVTDRGRRLRIIKAAVSEFEKKLRAYVKPDADPAAVTTAAERPDAPLPDMSPVFFTIKGDMSKF